MPQFGRPWPPTAAEVIEHLRKPGVIDNLRVRSEVKQLARQFLTTDGFIELDVPSFGPPIEEYTKQQLGTVTPDGRHFFLNQSPQFFKQTMVIHGLDRVFQFAHCYRWEELDPERSDQLRGLVQLDLEMATDDGTVVREIIERLLLDVCNHFGIACPTPFPVMDAVECVQRYGTDKPLIPCPEGELQFVWVIDFPFFVVDRDGKRKPPDRHIFCKPHRRPGEITNLDELLDLRTHSYDLVVNGQELAGGDVRVNDSRLLSDIIDFFGLSRPGFEILLEVLGSDARPHAGIAVGFDRLLMNLVRARHIVDVNAFPQWIM